MKLNFLYDISPRRVMREPDFCKKLELIRAAGVEHIDLHRYFYGHEVSSDEDISAAKVRLEDMGFSTGVLFVPFGHGGNALDPNDPTIPLEVGKGWHNTCDRNGNVRINTTCPDELVISDTLKQVEICRQMGFSRVTYDDDLRLGFWGHDMHGCYCPRCMEEFNRLIGREVTRDEIYSESDSELSEAWMNYQCEKINRFLLGVTPKGITSLAMVMHDGGRKHGVDIKHLRELMPDNLMFRVGEAHFNDREFEAPGAKESIVNSIMTHLSLIGNNDIAFSETTVYPVPELSPENWVEKMRIEIDCGLRNLYLMSGTAVLPDEYWIYLKNHLDELRERSLR